MVLLRVSKDGIQVNEHGMAPFGEYDEWEDTRYEIQDTR